MAPTTAKHRRNSLAVLGILAFASIVVLAGTSTGAEPATAESSASVPDAAALADGAERLLLLSNGQVIRGRVALEGDRYIVSVPRAELRIPRRDVDFVVRTIEEGFHLKRASLVDNNCNDHLRLAQWCLAQEMLNDAESELTRAEELEPHHPRLELMRRQLKLAREPAKLAPPPTEIAVPPSADAKLDSLVRDLPSASVETFAKTVQPILTNHCAAAGCHGIGTKSQFQLIRLNRDETPTNRVTQRNLQAVLNWVDTQQPEKSRLLVAAREAHGGAARAGFKSTDAAAYRHLAAWIQQLSAPNPQGPPETFDSTSSTLSQSIPAANERPAPPPREPRSSPRRNERITPRGNVATTAGIRAKPTPAIEPATDPIPAVDPFDPDQFNRRYHPPAAAEPATR